MNDDPIFRFSYLKENCNNHRKICDTSAQNQSEVAIFTF